MALAVCARDVKFYEWPNINFMGAYEVTAECMSVKSICWCNDGSNLLVVKSKGEPLLVIPAKSAITRVSTSKCLPLHNIYAGVYSKINPSLLAFGMENGEVNLFNMESKDLIRYKKLPTGIQNLDFSMDDKILLAGCFDGQIFLYDTKGRPAASFMIPNSFSLSTTLFSNYSNLLAGASKDGSLAVWDAESTDLKLFCKKHTARITDVAFLEHTVTSVGTDGFLCLFDLRNHELISKNNLDGALSSLAYFPGTYDLAVGTYNQLRSYDLRNLNTPIRTLLINNGGHIKKIAAAPVAFPCSPQSSDKEAVRTPFDPRLSASGDFSTSSGATSEYRFKDLASNDKSASGSGKTRTFKRSEVKELEKFVNDYLKHSSLQFAQKMGQSFFGMRINTSKQFICMGEKMDESWNNFISYLRYAGDSEGNSTLGSKVGSEKNIPKP